MHVLITGGAGLVGSHIADLLVQRSGEMPCARILVVDNFVRGLRDNLAWAFAHGPVEIVEGDIRNRALISDLMQGIDLVFHQAALRITQCAEDPRLALEVLVDGTFNVLEAAAQAKVKKVVAASTASVYGMADRFPTDETHHPYNNRTMYGASKVFNEGLLRTFHEMYGLPYIALRYFNIYGSRMDMYGVYTEVLIRWMEHIETGKPPLIFGTGEQTMDFVHVKDIARANLLAARSALSDEVFNIGSSTETSLNQLAETLLKVMKSGLKPEYHPERKVNPVPRRLSDIRKAKKMLNYEPRISLEEGLNELVTWWRARRNQAGSRVS